LLSALLQGFITHSFRGSQGIISALEFHPDPKRLWLFSAASADCHVRVWDLFAKKYGHAMQCRADPHQLLDVPYHAYRTY
jgi:WD40 repeat protein